jgi:hypothetical protein
MTSSATSSSDIFLINWIVIHLLLPLYWKECEWRKGNGAIVRCHDRVHLLFSLLVSVAESGDAPPGSRLNILRGGFMMMVGLVW